MSAQSYYLAHAQRTRSFIISLAVRQHLHMRFRFSEYFFCSSMIAASSVERWIYGRIGGSRGVVNELIASKKLSGSRFKIALGVQMALAVSPA